MVDAFLDPGMNGLLVCADGLAFYVLNKAQAPVGERVNRKAKIVDVQNVEPPEMLLRDFKIRSDDVLMDHGFHPSIS